MKTPPRTLSLALLVASTTAVGLAVSSAAPTLQDNPKVGYSDTPFLPGGKWRVHDGSRPQPRVVTPGARLGDAPSDAIVLFDGTNLDAWRSGDDAGKWKLVEAGAMEVVPGTGKLTTREEFGDCQLHIEWASPLEVKGNSQGRGNSGVFLLGRYEVQVLDSYENPTYPDGQAAALYGQTPPDVNACRKPGEFQAYDIFFRAPRFSEDGEVLSPALVTVMHNGVLVHHARELIGATTHKRVATYSKHGPEGPIELQDHGNPTRFRNIWVRRLDR